MKLEAYCTYDNKAKAYTPPFFIRSRGEAVRSFADQCNKPDNMFHDHPEDFVLYQVGVYDDTTGILEKIEPFENLGLASQYKNLEEFKNPEKVQ